MAHFAEIGLNNIVERVIVVHNNELLDENGNEVEQNGINFCRNLLGGNLATNELQRKYAKKLCGVGVHLRLSARRIYSSKTV